MADLHTFWNELDALPTEERPLPKATAWPMLYWQKYTSNPAKHRAKNLYTVQKPPSAAAFLSGAGHWPESPPAWPYCAGSIQ